MLVTAQKPYQTLAFRVSRRVWGLGFSHSLTFLYILQYLKDNKRSETMIPATEKTYEMANFLKADLQSLSVASSLSKESQ